MMRRPDTFAAHAVPSRFRRSLRLFRTAVRTALDLLFLLLLALQFAWSERYPLFEGPLRRTLRSVLLSEIGTETEIGEIKGSYFREVVLRNVVFRKFHRAPAVRSLRIESLSVTLDPLKLAAGDAAGITAVRIQGVRAEIDLDEPGPEPEEPAAGEPEEFPDLGKIPLPAVDGKDIEVTVRGGGRLLVLRGVALRSDGGTLASAAADLSWSEGTLTHGEKELCSGKGGVRLKTAGGRLHLTLEGGEESRPLLRCTMQTPPPGKGGRVGFEALLNPWTRGKIRLEGEMAWPPGTGFTASGKMEKLDLARVLSCLPPYRSTVSGTLDADFELAGPSSDLSDFTGRVDAVATDFRSGEFSLPRVEAGWSLRKGRRVQGNVRTAREQSTLRLDADAVWNGPVEFTLKIDSPDLGELLPRGPGVPARGSVEFQGACTCLETDPSFSGRVRSAWTDLAGARDFRALAGVHLWGGGIRFSDAVVIGTAARCQGSGEVLWKDESALSFEAVLTGESLGCLVPRSFVPEPALDGKGRAEAKLVLRDRSLAVRGKVDLDRFEGPSGTVENVSARVELTGETLSVRDFSAETAGLGVLFTAGNLRFGGETAEVRLEGLALAWNKERLWSEEALRAAFGKEAVRVEPFWLRGDAGELKGEFSLAEGELRGRFEAATADASRLASLLGGDAGIARGRAFVAMDLSGRLENPAVRLGASFQDLSLEDGPSGLEGELRAALESGAVTVSRVSVRGDAGYLEGRGGFPLALNLEEGIDTAALADTLYQSSGTSLSLKGKVSDFGKLWPRGDWRGRASFQLKAQGPLETGRARASVTAQNFGTRSFTARKIRLHLEGNEKGWRVQRGAVHLPFADMSVRGEIPLRIFPFRTEEGWQVQPYDEDAAFALRIRCDELEVEGLAQALGLPSFLAQCRGRGGFEVGVSGGWNSPRVHLKGAVQDVTNPGLAKTCGARVEAEAEDGWVRLRTFEVRPGDGVIRVRGRFPLRLDIDALRSGTLVPEDAEVDLGADLEDLDVGLLQPALADVKTMRGVLAGKASVSGPWREAKVEAEVALRDGVVSLKSRTLPRFDALSGTLAFRDRELRLNVQGECSGGKVAVEGKLGMERGRVEDIHVRFRGWDKPLVLAGDPARVRANFGLLLSGTPEAARLEGLVQVLRTRISRRIDLAADSAGGGGIVPGFVIPGIEKLSLDVAVRSPEGIKVLSTIHNAGIQVADVEVELEGDMRLRGTAGDPLLTGLVRLRKGTADLPLYRVRMVHGQVRLLESNPDNPQINMLGKTIRGKRTIFIAVNGPLSGPEIAFNADPPMPQDEIKVYLATGLNPAELRGRQVGETIGVQVLTLVAKQITPHIFGRSEGESLLDRVSFSSEKDPITRETRYFAEFRVFDWLFLVGEKDEYGYYNGKVKLRFGFKLK
jgi:hypothetical protein